MNGDEKMKALDLINNKLNFTSIKANLVQGFNIKTNNCLDCNCIDCDDDADCSTAW